jgi:hypothetical protein
MISSDWISEILEGDHTIVSAAELLQGHVGIIDTAKGVDGEPALDHHNGYGSCDHEWQRLEWHVAVGLQLAPEKHKSFKSSIMRRSENPTEGAAHLQCCCLPSDALTGESLAIRWLLLLTEHVHVEDALEAKVGTSSVASIMILTNRTMVEANLLQCRCSPEATPTIEWSMLEGRLRGHVLWLRGITNCDQNAIWMALALILVTWSAEAIIQTVSVGGLCNVVAVTNVL